MKLESLLATILIVCGLNSSVNSLAYENVTGIVDTLLSNYDKRLRPNYGGPPTEVEVTMYILSVSDMSDTNMDYTIDFYFREFWNDPRLAFTKTPDCDSFSFGHDLGKQIWLPDLFFVSEKSSFLHATTTKNEFIKIHASGNVTRSIRLSVTAACPMNFKAFPFDSQICTLDIESYGSNAKGMKLSWKNPEKSVGIAEDLSLETFEYVGHSEKASITTVSNDNVIASYSRLYLELEFKRLSGHYIRQIYIPMTMLVIISWMSFWLKSQQTRMIVTAAILFTMCYMCQLFASVELPKTEYNKAVDIFTGVCITFSFIAFTVFLYVNNNSQDTTKAPPSKVDRVCQIAFPLCFVLFNGIYWAVY